MIFLRLGAKQMQALTYGALPHRPQLTTTTIFIIIITTSSISIILARLPRSADPDLPPLIGMITGSPSRPSSNVRVILRIRPLSPSAFLAEQHSSYSSSSTTTCTAPSNNTLIYSAPVSLTQEGFASNHSSQAFEFDRVLGEASNQEDVWRCLLQDSTPLENGSFIQDFLHGINCCILAYGQTGTGKTFTMGTGDHLARSSEGIVPRTIHAVLDGLAQRAAQCSTFEADIYLSFVEIYNEEIRDLMVPSSSSTSAAKTKISIRESMGEIMLTGAREERVLVSGRQPLEVCQEVLRWLHRGILARTTKSTEMNVQSSRSHAIFTLTLRQSGGGGPGHLCRPLQQDELCGPGRV